MALAIDGQNSVSITSATPGLTLTTTGTSNIIIFIARANPVCGGITSITDTAGLTWTRRLTFLFPGTSTANVEVWYAVTTSPYAGGTITANYTTPTADTKRLIAYSVSGVLTTAPFDPSPTFPSYKTALASTAMTATVPPLDTLNANSVIFDILGTASGAGTITAPAGYTALTAPLGTAHAGAFKVYSSTQTGLTPQYSWTVSNDAFGIWDAYTSDASVLSAGSAIKTATGNGTATVTVAPAGGTAPYTYQWYRSTASGFTPGAGNIVSGATSATLADTGLTNGTVYYYKCNITDAVAANVTSNQTAAVPNGAKYILLIGDSYNTTTCTTISTTAVTGSQAAGDILQQKLQALYSDGTSVTVLNRGIGGTNGDDWITTHLAPALAAALVVKAGASNWTVLVHLGGNDASMNFSNPLGGESLAQYQAYMQSIANSIISWGANAVIFNGPPYLRPQGTNRTEAGTALLQSYYTAIRNIVAATPKVYLGFDEFAFLVNDQSLIGGDKVHPTPADANGQGGATSLAVGWAKAAYAVITPTATWSHY